MGTDKKTEITTDPGELAQFFELVRVRTGFDPPEPWRQAILHAHVSTTFGEHTTFGWGCSVAGSRTELAAAPGPAIAQPEARGGYPYHLLAPGRWTTDVWAAGRTGPFTGWGPHEVILLGKGETLCIFGWESHGAYLEAFVAKTGKPLFRFSTSYWFHGSEDWVYPVDRSPAPPEDSKPRGRKGRRQNP